MHQILLENVGKRCSQMCLFILLYFPQPELTHKLGKDH